MCLFDRVLKTVTLFTLHMAYQCFRKLVRPNLTWIYYEASIIFKTIFYQGGKGSPGGPELGPGGPLNPPRPLKPPRPLFGGPELPR